MINNRRNNMRTYKALTLAERIRKAREHLGYSRRKLAEKIGVTDESILYWENGRNNPSAFNFFKLQKFFNSKKIFFGFN